VKEKLSEAAEAASAKAKSASGSTRGSDSPVSKLNPESTALQDNPGPQGDLP
jgi:hypothetical protein